MAYDLGPIPHMHPKTEKSVDPRKIMFVMVERRKAIDVYRTYEINKPSPEEIAGYVTLCRERFAVPQVLVGEFFPTGLKGRMLEVAAAVANNVKCRLMFMDELTGVHKTESAAAN